MLRTVEPSELPAYLRQLEATANEILPNLGFSADETRRFVERA